MCLAIPAEVEEIFPEKEEALVSMGGVRERISIALLDGVKVGDYVIERSGFASGRVDPEEADKMIQLMLQQAMNGAVLLPV